MQWERAESESAEMETDGAATPVAAQDQRIRFANSERFQAVWAEGIAGNLIPVAVAVAAPAARYARIYLFGRRKPQAVHGEVSKRGPLGSSFFIGMLRMRIDPGGRESA
jgi:hypothetical protein